LEASNEILWRETDAIKNSITSLARCFFSDKDLFKKNSQNKIEMMKEIGVIWENYPEFFKRGVYFQRKYDLKKFDAEEIENLPLNHEARKNLNFEFERSFIKKIENIPYLKDIENKVNFLIFGKDPIKKEIKEK
jgi:tRNA(His) 5'-end guanylyltransferase